MRGNYVAFHSAQATPSCRLMRVGDVQCAVPCKGAEGLRLPTRCSPPTSVGARARAGLKGRHQAVHRAIPNAGGGRACVRPRRDRPARPRLPGSVLRQPAGRLHRGGRAAAEGHAAGAGQGRAGGLAPEGAAPPRGLGGLSCTCSPSCLRCHSEVLCVHKRRRLSSQGAPQSVVPARQARCIPDWLQPWHGGGRLNTLPPLSCSPHSSGLPSCWADNHGLRWSACNAAAWG